MELGERIKVIRVSLGETMEQFGQRFNTSKGTVNNWEKGRNAPNKANLKRLLIYQITRGSLYRCILHKYRKGQAWN